MGGGDIKCSWKRAERTVEVTFDVLAVVTGIFFLVVVGSFLSDAVVLSAGAAAVVCCSRGCCVVCSSLVVVSPAAWLVWVWPPAIVGPALAVVIDCSATESLLLLVVCGPAVVVTSPASPSVTVVTGTSADWVVPGDSVVSVGGGDCDALTHSVVTSNSCTSNPTLHHRPSNAYTVWRNKKRGHHLIANILKFHDRIAWKLVNFCNIICWTQS